MKKLLFAALSLTIAGTASAQSTAYYITNGDGATAFIVKNGVVQSTFALGGTREYALRVSNSGLVIADRNLSQTISYSLTGVAGATTSNSPQSLEQFLDGGTDGTFTYGARCCSTDVAARGIYRGNMNFGGMTQIASGFDASGVTYGAGFVWATGLSDGILRQLTTGGALVNSWDLSSLGGTLSALAFETSTNSLWFGLNGSGNIYNYSTTGQQLNHLTVNGLSGNYFGGEMVAGDGVPSTVPEPSTYALMAAGLAAVAVVRRRRNA